MALIIEDGIIIEDGTNVEGANSFVTVEECRAFAEARGLTLPVDDSDVEILLIKAVDYLNSIENRFQGHRYFYSDGQNLCFPPARISAQFLLAGPIIGQPAARGSF